MATWDDVSRGWVVKDKNGQEWTVTARDGAEITISAPGQPSFTRAFTGEVEIVSQPAPQHDSRVQDATAKGLIAVKFGGVEVGKQGKDKNKPWMTPVEFDDAGSMLAHLRIFHGSMSDEPTLAGLRKEHVALHDPAARTTSMYEPHHHDPDYEDR